MILGVDLGFTRNNPLAIACISFADVYPKHVTSKCLAPPDALKWHEAVDWVLEAADDEISRLCRIYKVSLIAYEYPHLEKNPQTPIKLAHLGGGIRLIARRSGVECIDIQPQHAKKAATGRGNATKADMIRAAFIRFGKKLPKDEADAAWIAVAAAIITKRHVEKEIA